jgi:hypothetical protein
MTRKQLFIFPAPIHFHRPRQNNIMISATSVRIEGH